MTDSSSHATIVAVSLSHGHSFSKVPHPVIRVRAGLGVEQDAHSGRTVQHLSRVRRDPSQPNLRQVHLIHAELLAELAARGFAVRPGDMGENITTRGIDLLGLPARTRLHLGKTAIVEVTGLRNPCAQLDSFQPGLMAALLDRDDRGRLVRKAGIMAIVIEDGEIRPGDPVQLHLPPGAPAPLDVV